MSNLQKRQIGLTPQMWEKLEDRDPGLGVSYVLRELVGKALRIPEKERHGCPPKKSTTRK